MNTLSDINSTSIDKPPMHLDAVLNDAIIHKLERHTLDVDTLDVDTQDQQTYSVKSSGVKSNGASKLTHIDTALAGAENQSNAIKEYLLAHPGIGNYEIATNIPSMSNCEVFNWLIQAVKSGEVNYELGKYYLVEKQSAEHRALSCLAC